MNPTDVSKAMNTLTHGVYVLGVHANDKDNLMTGRLALPGGFLPRNVSGSGKYRTPDSGYDQRSRVFYRQCIKRYTKKYCSCLRPGFRTPKRTRQSW